MFDKYDAPFSSLLRDLGARFGATTWDDRGRVHLVKDGVDVTATVRQIGRDPLDWLGTSRELLEMVAIPPSPGLPEFQIYLEDFSSFIGKLFGAKDLELGVSAFDIRYVVRGDDEARIRRCLPPERCTALVGMRTQALSCRGDRIELSCMTDFDTDPAIPGPIERTQNALELMFALASTDCYGNQLLAGLPDATFREAPLPYVDIAGPGEIRIGFVRRHGRLGTEARATISLADIPTRTTERARALGAKLRRTDTGLAMTWSAVVADEAVLVAAIELLRELCEPPREGVFR